MADPTPLSDDELVSAYIDGELTDEDRARVEADPDLMALLHEMTPIVTAARTPVTPLAPDLVDDLVGRALDQGLTPEQAPAPPVATAPVIDLSERRARRNQLLTRVGAVAAGVAVIAIAGAILQNGLGGSDSDDTATEADSALDARDLMADDGEAETGGADAAEMAPPAADSADEESADAAAEDSVSAEGRIDEDDAADEESPEAEIVGLAPPDVAGLPADLGVVDLASVQLLVEDNLALLRETPPVDLFPRCADLTLLDDGFELVWWAEAVWEGSDAHVAAWRSPTELLVAVYPGPGGIEAGTENCAVIEAFAR